MDSYRGKEKPHESGKKKKTPKHPMEGMIEVAAAHHRRPVPKESPRHCEEVTKGEDLRCGRWLFHESTPRLWIGVVVEGEVDIVGACTAPGASGSLGRGAMIGEAALLYESAHTTGAFAPKGAMVWRSQSRVWEAVRQGKPEIFYRMVAQVARRISERLRYATEKLTAARARRNSSLGNVRWEHDLLGEREMPNSAYYGVQTQRAFENFPISGTPLKNFAHFVNGLAYVKKAAAMANCELGVLAKEKMEAIARHAMKS